MIAADLAKLDIFGTDYLFMLYESRLREVCFRSYVTDALGHITGVPTRWVEQAYNPPFISDEEQERPENPAEQQNPAEQRSASEIAASIIDGLGAILERGDDE